MLRDRLITAAIAVAILVPILIFGGVVGVVAPGTGSVRGGGLGAFQSSFRLKGTHCSILVCLFSVF